MCLRGRLLPRAVLTVLLGVLAALLVVPAGRAAVIGDDYPASVAKKNVDPWRFYSGQCTSFAAWRINHQLEFGFDDYWLVHWGNASNWKSAAKSAPVRAAGVTFDHTPRVGAIAWWAAGSAGSSRGHVAWVAVVNPTSITIEEYNYLHAEKYDVRTIARDDSRWPSGFIHFPPKTITNTVLPKISGTAQVGRTVKTSNGRWSEPDKTFSYQWFANGAAIKGATAKSLPIGPARVGKVLTVRVTVAKKGFTGSAATSAGTGAVAPGVFANPTAPSITGTAQVGSSLRASTGTWTPAGAYTYQWFAGTRAIAGATAATFTPGPAQVGTQVSVRVTAATAGYTSRTSASSPVTVAQGVLRARSTPSVSGAARVGSPLTVAPMTWNVTAPKVSYQWYADGAPIAGATGATFVPTLAQVDQHLVVAVRATSPGYAAANVRSVRTGPVTRGVVGFRGVPHITGQRLLGAVLTAHAPASTPAGARFGYQWFRGATPIAGATAATYRTVTADVGRHLSVRVSGAVASWTTGSVRSARIAVIRSVPVITAKADVRGARDRFVTVAVRVRAPGVAHVHGVAVVREGSHRLGTAPVRRGRATVKVGTMSSGRHHLTIRFKGAGASKSGTTRVVVVTG